MRRIKIDNRKVIAPNASLLGGRGNVVKAGKMFVYASSNGGGHSVARSLGRIAECDKDGEDCRGWIVAMVASNDFTFAFERWINPDDVLTVYDAPSNFAAVFFAPDLPAIGEAMRQLMAHGTIAERYIGKLPERIAELEHFGGLVNH